MWEKQLNRIFWIHERVDSKVKVAKNHGYKFLSVLIAILAKSSILAQTIFRSILIRAVGTI